MANPFVFKLGNLPHFSTFELSAFWGGSGAEIFLIVLGIFIALQLNEWKENRKQRATEILLLSDLQQDLEETQNLFTKRLKFDLQII